MKRPETLVSVYSFTVAVMVTDSFFGCVSLREWADLVWLACGDQTFRDEAVKFLTESRGEWEEPEKYMLRVGDRRLARVVKIPFLHVDDVGCISVCV